MVDWFPADTAGDPISVYHSNLLQVASTAREAAFTSEPSVANQLVSAANQLELLISDRYENPDCSSVGNIPGQNVECYSNSCLLWGRPDAGLVDEGLFALSCGEWQASVNNWTQQIANVLQNVDPGGAEYVQAVADTGENIQQEADDVFPDAGDILPTAVDALPGWIKFGAVVVGVLFVADKLR
jgi:hypothetical protein